MRAVRAIEMGLSSPDVDFIVAIRVRPANLVVRRVHPLWRSRAVGGSQSAFVCWKKPGKKRRRKTAAGCVESLGRL